MPLSSDLREFIECLNSNEVEYLVVGAFAVSWHGFPRYSADIDFLIRPSVPNAVRVLRALSQFGFGSLEISASDLTVPGRVIQLGYEPNRIDLLTSVTGISFDDAWTIGTPVIWMAFASTLSAGRLFSGIRMPPAVPKTGLTPKETEAVT
jgi:hypothetical protein